jgi:hypothetical protein
LLSIIGKLICAANPDIFLFSFSLLLFASILPGRGAYCPGALTESHPSAMSAPRDLVTW